MNHTFPFPPIDGPIGCFTAFFVCVDCGEIATECMEETHEGHECYYIGTGEDAVEFLNDILKDALKCIFKEQRGKIMNRPRTPPMEFGNINERIDRMFEEMDAEPRVKEVDEEKLAKPPKTTPPPAKDEITIDEKKVD
jgi:hypothetical protein